MRIIDWSSDVCSSDVRGLFFLIARRPQELRRAHDLAVIEGGAIGHRHRHRRQLHRRRQRLAEPLGGKLAVERVAEPAGPRVISVRRLRSEEHTSELQSLMRTSYAVFCLKKKKYTPNNNNTAQA